MPGKFRFQSTVSQSYYPEALFSVAFQNLGKIFWHLKKERQKLNYIAEAKVVEGEDAMHI